MLRLHPLTYSDEVVILRIFFPKLQRYDIYIDDTYVPPTNIDTSATKYQLIPENPDNPEEFFPTLSDVRAKAVCELTVVCLLVTIYTK